MRSTRRPRAAAACASCRSVAHRPGEVAARRVRKRAAVSVHQGCLTSATIAAPAHGSLHDPVSGRRRAYASRSRTADGAVIHDAPLPEQRRHVVGRPAGGGAPSRLRGRDARAIPARGRWAARPRCCRRRPAARQRRRRARWPRPRTFRRATSWRRCRRPPELRVPLQLEAGREVEVTLRARPERPRPQSGLRRHAPRHHAAASRTTA